MSATTAGRRDLEQFAAAHKPIMRGEIRVTNSAYNQPLSEGILCALKWGVSNTNGGGKSFEKARKFWAEKAQKRKQPGLCGRCAKPNANGFRQCDSCREYAAKYRGRDKSGPRIVPMEHLNAMVRRIASLEIAVATLQLDRKNKYRQGYNAAMRIMKNNARADDGVSFDDLAAMSHRYFRQ